jgi:predicted RNA binding protein YcfA (HicA-like mRNA interferase family)
MYRESDGSILTVPMHFSKIVPRGTLRTIIRSAGMTVDEFVRLLKI